MFQHIVEFFILTILYAKVGRHYTSYTSGTVEGTETTWIMSRCITVSQEQGNKEKQQRHLTYSLQVILGNKCNIWGSSATRENVVVYSDFRSTEILEEKKRGKDRRK